MKAIVRVFRQTQNAQDAYQELIESGFSANEVELTAQGDEAGAVKGNFAVGNQSDADFTGNEAGDYDGNFNKVEFGAVYLMQVNAGTVEAARAAEEILDRFGGETSAP